MPDFEIRYFHADGKLALVHVTTHDTVDAAREHAQLHIGDYAHYELRDGAGQALVVR